MSKSAQPIAKMIAQALEQRIIEGLHEQPVPLRQAELALEFGTSHIPVREALATLAEKGLVQIIPNRGAVVVPMSAKQCNELAGMRVALELVAIRAAVPNLAEAHLKRAQTALARGRAAVKLALRAQQNWEFHRAIYSAGDQPFLLSQLEALWRHADRYLMFAWSRAHYEERSDSEHEAILRACAQGDSRLTCRLTKAHIESAATNVARLLQITQQSSA